MQFILYAILAYILYNVIFRFIIPVYIATRKIKKGFRNMQEKMQDQQKGFNPQTSPPPQSSSPRKGDYIDFEEIK